MDDNLTLFRVKLGLRIKQLREERKLAQAVLASKIDKGKDKQVISRYENQGANPTAYQLMQLGEALEYTVDKFFDFSEIDPKDVDTILKKLRIAAEKKIEKANKKATD